MHFLQIDGEAASPGDATRVAIPERKKAPSEDGA
jgi:hypothetical protein